jgi:uncharacterized protein (TIGR03086 family)
MIGGVDEQRTQEIADRWDRVAGRFGERVAEVPAEAWERPAPPEGWVARDVVRHLVEWVPAFMADAGAPELPEVPSVDDDPVAAWTALERGLRAWLADPELAATTISHPMAGTHRLDDALAQFVLGDVLVHTWDLARATGLDEALDPEAVHDLLTGMQPIEDLLRQSGQCGPKVEVPADADEQARLIAFTGRQP